jgi:multiple sugar transport system permease protein
MAAQALTIVGRRKKSPLGRFLAWAALILVILSILAPFYWVIRTALATKADLFANPGQLTPPGFTWNNFARVLGMVSAEDAIAAGGSGQQIHFFLYLRNSVVVTALIVAGQLFFCSLAAYAFARLNFPLRDKIFFLYIAALMIPGIVTLIPNYILIRNLGWLNTFQGIVAPSFLMSPFAVFFLRQFFLGINREIEEAAKIDGASLIRIFGNLIVPMSIPSLATLGILTWISSWNDYLWPLLVGKEENVRVLTVALGVFKSQTPQGSPDWGGLMAGALLSILPSIALFLAFGRRAINSIQFSGIK